MIKSVVFAVLYGVLVYVVLLVMNIGETQANIEPMSGVVRGAIDVVAIGAMIFVGSMLLKKRG